MTAVTPSMTTSSNAILAGVPRKLSRPGSKRRWNGISTIKTGGRKSSIAAIKQRALGWSSGVRRRREPRIAAPLLIGNHAKYGHRPNAKGLVGDPVSELRNGASMLD